VIQGHEENVVKIEEVRSKTDSELEYELESMGKELFDLSFRSATETAANPARMQTLRKAIARVHTVMHERTSGIRGQEPRKS
jgi:large subunit ribosomal protein L29